MKVKELAKKLGVTAETVRFYTRKGYLAPIKSQSNGYKLYGAQDLSRMQFILSARSLGFTVKDIGEILAVSDKKNAPCPMVRQLIEQRLLETEAQFIETKKLRDRMRSAVREWNSQSKTQPTGHEICHLIEAFTLNHPDGDNNE